MGDTTPPATTTGLFEFFSLLPVSSTSPSQDHNTRLMVMTTPPSSSVKTRIWVVMCCRQPYECSSLDNLMTPLLGLKQDTVLPSFK
ncbi:hypothetical protein E2C01_052492 [Portunus trituberculatus]|uniref:Uncharacterized protein n=1 Tax=Portunus trituberculatus TaxID=210409 RepID=A0A5B7GML3_PORTR|nr:hypothetical protein [Portunus trituberculatus]